MITWALVWIFGAQLTGLWVHTIDPERDQNDWRLLVAWTFACWPLITLAAVVVAVLHVARDVARKVAQSLTRSE